MDPTLSTSDAHVLFGKLYRKERPPGYQQKIDEIVASTSDVFVRIERIEELDQSIFAKNKGVEVRKGKSGGRRFTGAGGGRGGSRARGGNPQSGSKTGGRRRTGKDSSQSIGFFERLFGSDLSRWGNRTGTLESGFLQRTPKLAIEVQSVFRQLREDQIKATVAAFRSVMGVAWTELPPARYNILIAAYQFLTEFIKSESIFRTLGSPADLITATIKLQKHYATLLTFPDWSDVLQKDFLKLVQETENHAGNSAMIHETMQIVGNLEKNKPTLKNTFLAFYGLARKRVVEWEDLERELKIGTPQLKKYRAPEPVMQRIAQKAREIKNKYESNKLAIKDIERVKREYFDTDENGKLKTDFLDGLVEDVLRRTHNEQNMPKSVVHSHKSEPHKLLYCVLKDLDLNLMFLLTGSVTTRLEGAQTQDVLIFQAGLFKRHMDQFNHVYRDMEQYNKKNKDSSYTFTQYLRDLKKSTEDQDVKFFLKVVRGSMAMFSKLVSDLQTVLDNHQRAVETEKIGKATDQLLAGKSVYIENFDQNMRFVPHANEEIVASSRMSGHTVEQVLKEYLRNIYNYLFIFRDPDIGETLNSIPRLQSENDEIRTELQRMGLFDEGDQ